MRPALFLSALLLTVGLAAATAPAASAAPSCAGTVDVMCDSSYCDDYTPDGCFHRTGVYCPVYVDPTRVTGEEENQYTVYCYLLNPF